jgi:hypothetical protein
MALEIYFSRLKIVTFFCALIKNGNSCWFLRDSKNIFLNKVLRATNHMLCEIIMWNCQGHLNSFVWDRFKNDNCSNLLDFFFCFEGRAVNERIEFLFWL